MEYYEEGRFNSSLAHSISPRSDKESQFTHPPDQTGKARNGTPGTKQAVPVGPNQKEEQLATPEQLQLLRHRILTQLLEERD